MKNKNSGYIDGIPEDLRLLSNDEWFRFHDQVEITPWGCWYWRGRLDKDGYGIFTLRGKNRKAHRVCFSTYFDQVRLPGTIDHLCRVRYCINPDHLDLVSMGENTLRGNGITAKHRRKHYCSNGHELTPDNIYSNGTGRSCKICTLTYSKTKIPCPICGKFYARGGIRGHIRREHE